MAVPVNDRDLFLYNASVRDVDPRASRTVILGVTSPLFRVNTSNVAYPAAIDFTAQYIGIASTATAAFSVSSGATLTGTGNTRNLKFTDMSVDSVTVTVTVTENGQTFTDSKTVSKFQDGVQGSNGSNGTPGNTVIVTFLYKYTTVTPAAPTGTATCTTADLKNTSYSGSDGWYVDPPANPNTPGISLWTATKSISVPYGVLTTAVTYSSGATVAALVANGANGTNGTNGANGQPGAPGVKSTTANVYQWAIGPAPTISGTSTWTWASASLDTAPTGWFKSTPEAPSLGYTLYQAAVGIVDTSGATQSTVAWGGASIVGISYKPTNGATGTNGTTGKSVAIAYTLVNGNTLATAPATSTIPGTGLPNTGDWGSTNAWTPQPGAPSAGQSVFQSNGIYDGVNTVWGVPYLSSFRVGSLSALTINTGKLTISDTISSANGNFAVDSSGNVTMKSASMSNGKFTAGNINAWNQWPVAGGGSVTYLGPEGLMMGNYNDGRWAVIYANGDISTPQFYSTAGRAFFNGTLGANIVTADNIQAGAITAGKIQAGAITADKLAAGAITTSVLGVGAFDNIVPDSNMMDPTFWATNPNQFIAYPSTFWRSTRVISIGMETFTDRSTPMFKIAAGATYLFEYQMYLSGDFTGNITVVAHLPKQAWFAMGGPDRGYPWGNDQGGLRVNYDGNSPKGVKENQASIRVLNSAEGANADGSNSSGQMQFRIVAQCFSGYWQVGGFRVTRMSDNVLIANGAVTAEKIQVGSLNAISSIVTARAGGWGAGIDQDANGIRIYDGNNIRRVQLGNLDV